MTVNGSLSFNLVLLGGGHWALLKQATLSVTGKPVHKIKASVFFLWPGQARKKQRGILFSKTSMSISQQCHASEKFCRACTCGMIACRNANFTPLTLSLTRIAFILCSGSDLVSRRSIRGCSHRRRVFAHLGTDSCLRNAIGRGGNPRRTFLPFRSPRGPMC